MMLHRSRMPSPVPEGMEHKQDDLRKEDVHRATGPPMPPVRRQREQEEDAPDQDSEDLDYGVLDADAS